jgi:hypothetical protein
MFHTPVTVSVSAWTIIGAQNTASRAKRVEKRFMTTYFGAGTQNIKRPRLIVSRKHQSVTFLAQAASP